MQLFKKRRGSAHPKIVTSFYGSNIGNKPAAIPPLCVAPPPIEPEACLDTAFNAWLHDILTGRQFDGLQAAPTNSPRLTSRDFQPQPY